MTAIRRATFDDAAAIGTLLGELGYPTSAADAERRMRIVDKSDNAILVAEDHAGAVVAFASLHRMSALHAAAPVGYITAFCVSGSQRGKGVGRMLLSACERWARDAGCGRLTVTSAEQRDGAHKFYPACGLPYSGRRYSKTLT